MEKILSISLNLNFTPNTLGCYGLTKPIAKARAAKLGQERRRKLLFAIAPLGCR